MALKRMSAMTKLASLLIQTQFILWIIISVSSIEY